MYIYGCTCLDCKHYKGGNECKILTPWPVCSPDIFVCDFFRRKNSGAYRRKLKKLLKESEDK